jgi:hypothetical protein
VKPLYKKGNRESISNYRPISLLPPFSKTLEKVIFNRLYQHCIDNNILSVHQYGFKLGSSTDKTIFNLINEIYVAFNKRERVGGIFCDLQKASDSVNHEMLKLKFYGVKGNFFNLIKTYLENRFKKVQNYTEHCKKVTSNNWRIVSHGVPQGSILGPLLFFLYINDLPSILQPYATHVLFADDTSIILKNNTTNDFLKNCRETFTELNLWFVSNELFLNYEKQTSYSLGPKTRVAWI